MMNISKKDLECGFYVIGYEYYDYDCEKQCSEERRRYRTREAAERARNRKRYPSVYTILYYTPKCCKQIHEMNQKFMK